MKSPHVASGRRRGCDLLGGDRNPCSIRRANPQRPRVTGTLSPRYRGDFGPRVVVEPGEQGGFCVTARPLFQHRPRHFPIAVDALDFAELLAGEIGGTVLDRTEARA